MQLDCSVGSSIFLWFLIICVIIFLLFLVYFFSTTFDSACPRKPELYIELQLWNCKGKNLVNWLVCLQLHVLCNV